MNLITGPKKEDGPEYCPECKEHYTVLARHPQMTRRCKNGHTWHQCLCCERKLPGKGGESQREDHCLACFPPFPVPTDPMQAMGKKIPEKTKAKAVTVLVEMGYAFERSVTAISTLALHFQEDQPLAAERYCREHFGNNGVMLYYRLAAELLAGVGRK